MNAPAPVRPPRLRRVALVSYFNPVSATTGGAMYFGSVARALRDIGCAPHLVVLDPAAWGHPASPVERRLLAPFESVWGGRAALAAGRFWSLDPGRWIGYAARRLARRAPAAAEAEGAARPAEIARAAARVRAVAAEAVIAWRPFATPIFDALPPDVRRIYLVDDVYALRARSFAATGTPPPFPPSLVARERAGLRAADVNLAIQREEADHIRAENPAAPVLVAPHGCDVAAGDLGGARGPVCLFVGAAQTRANLDGLGWFLDAVWPRVRAAAPQARLRVCGTAADAMRTMRAGAALDGVDLVGFAPDLGAEYAAAAVAIAPLRHGSGLKIKLVEALAAGVPVVATSVGAQGAADAPAAALDVADAPEAYAAALVARLAAGGDAVARRAARDFAEAHFSRRALERALVEALS